MKMFHLSAAILVLQSLCASSIDGACKNSTSNPGYPEGKPEITNFEVCTSAARMSVCVPCPNAKQIHQFNIRIWKRANKGTCHPVGLTGEDDNDIQYIEIVSHS